jgi:serine/threonine-protein kinase RsbW
VSEERRIDVRIPSRYQDIDLVRRVMAAARADIPLTPDAQLKLEICVVEGVGNAIRHAYGLRGDGVVEVVLRLGAAQLVVEITDRGRPMSPENRRRLTDGPDPAAPDDLPVGEIPEGGMGFPILRAVLDGLEYTSDDGRNTLRLTKLFNHSPAATA